MTSIGCGRGEGLSEAGRPSRLPDGVRTRPTFCFKAPHAPITLSLRQWRKESVIGAWGALKQNVGRVLTPSGKRLGRPASLKPSPRPQPMEVMSEAFSELIELHFSNENDHLQVNLAL